MAPPFGGIVPCNDPAHRARLITIHTRRLQELEARAALEGARTPPEVQIEIDGMRRALARLRA